MYHVYSDESGQTGRDYEDKAQPVLCQTAGIIESENIPFIENKTKRLLRKYDLPEEEEIHAHPCLLGLRIFQKLEKNQRHELLKEFIQINLEYVYKILNMGMLKSFVIDEVRNNANKSGLDPFMQGYIWLILIIDKHFEHVKKDNYKYFFDATDNYKKQIYKTTQILKAIPQDSLKINCMIGDPKEKNSEDSRVIQLADVVGYYLNRHRQIEIRTFKHRDSLDKHKEKIIEIHEMVKPKFLKFIGNIITQKIDWKALQTYDFIKL